MVTPVFSPTLTGVIDKAVILRILGKEPPPPYEARGKAADFARVFTWIDLGPQWPDMVTPRPEEASYHSEEITKRACQAARIDADRTGFYDHECGFDEKVYNQIYIADCLGQLELIDSIHQLQKEFFEGLLALSDNDKVQAAAEPEIGGDVVHSGGRGIMQQHEYDGDEMDYDGTDDSQDEEPVQEEEGPRQCEKDAVRLDDQVRAYREQLYRNTSDKVEKKLCRLEQDRLQWEEMLKMAFDRWLKEEPEDAKAFKFHLLNACIVSQSLVRIYNILRWMPTPTYVRLALHEVSKVYHQQAPLICELHHIVLGWLGANCALDHRLDDYLYAVEHLQHADYGFEHNSFRNGFDDYVGRFKGRMSIIHLIASMEVRLVKVRGRLLEDKWHANSIGRGLVGRWYDIVESWCLETRRCRDVARREVPQTLLMFEKRTDDRLKAWRYIIEGETGARYTSDYEPIEYDDARRGDPRRRH